MRRIYPFSNVSCVSLLDKSRLEQMIASRFCGSPLSPQAQRVLKLLQEADFAVLPDDVPRDLVTMNSTVHLVDPIRSEEWDVTLVYPEEHDPAGNRWSILSTVGAELFGKRRYEPVRAKREDLPQADWVVADIPFQPEASGVFL